MGVAIELVERGLVPDWVTRAGIRRLNRQRLRESRRLHAGDPDAVEREFARQLASSPIALSTAAANEQHYELPASFFVRVLGPHLKYSSCFWEDGAASLGDAEAAMLELSCRRADLRDGMSILELGCGWGSLTLWMAQHYPSSRVTAVSNSSGQRAFIESRRDELGLDNLEVITCDMNDFDPGRRFDRVVSIEMFEHMRNYRELLRRVASWLAPEGRLFLHIFCHRAFSYLFETEGDDNWMGRHFFTGGMMPAETLLGRFDDHLRVEESWSVCGTNYARTAEAWLENQESRRDEVMEILIDHYQGEASRWYERWRVFFMACAELFGHDGGREWFVSHSRFIATR